MMRGHNATVRACGSDQKRAEKHGQPPACGIAQSRFSLAGKYRGDGSHRRNGNVRFAHRRHRWLRHAFRADGRLQRRQFCRDLLIDRRALAGLHLQKFAATHAAHFLRRRHRHTFLRTQTCWSALDEQKRDEKQPGLKLHFGDLNQYVSTAPMRFAIPAFSARRAGDAGTRIPPMTARSE